MSPSTRPKWPAGVTVWSAVATLATILAAPLAQAQFVGQAAASAQVESNSNVFDVNSGTPLPAHGNASRGDVTLGYGAQFGFKYAWSGQQLYASAGTTEFDYQRHTELDHEDYRLNTGLNWVLTDILSGKLDILRHRSMVPFYNLSGTTLSLETEQAESLEAALKITPQWRLDAQGRHSKLSEPLPEAPDLSLSDTSERLALQYLGIARLTAGSFVGYEKASYEATELGVQPNYHQYSAGMAANYSSPRTTFEGQVGYARRISVDQNNTGKGLTGQVDLRERLTPKTTVSFSLGRNLVNYVFNSGTETDSSAGIGADWQLSYKLQVTLGYTYLYRFYPGQGNNPPGSDRIEHQQMGTLGINYTPLRWLIIRPYGNLQRRGSNYIGGAFDSTIFGVSFTVKSPDKPQAVN